MPYGRPLERVRPYKHSRRREDDIAIVTAGVRVLLEPEAGGSYVVREAGVGMGGVAPPWEQARQLDITPWDSGRSAGYHPFRRGMPPGYRPLG